MRKISSLLVALIQPSRYDDEGFVIQYCKGVLPSNTLACLRSLTLDFADSWKKDKDITITVESYDEVVNTIPFQKLAKKNKGSNKVVAALVGVQSNQFARASDMAKKLTSLGIKTLIGGFHVSGIISLFGKPSPEMKELMDLGITLVHGEAENRWESILMDVVNGTERPLYVMDDFPIISQAPVPQPDSGYMKKFAHSFLGTIDCSRGCPFNCRFCTVVNVQGHKMRHRSAEKIHSSIRENLHKGITEYFFTDDNFSRNPEWEKILDGIIEMREKEGLDLNIMIQVDTRSHKIPRFTEKVSRAGCTQVFIGMESINPKNIESAGKQQNQVDDYASFIEAWHEVGVMTHVGYIIGLPYDTPESVHDDIRRLKDEVKVDLASFFMLTPLPGSNDHYNLVTSGQYVDPDLNKYDGFHAVMEHPLMTAEEWNVAYNDAWESFYTFDNIRNVLMRAGNKQYWSIFKNVMWYKNSLLEPRHPMVAGFIRLKNRTDVRPGTPIPGFWEYYRRRTVEFAKGFWKRVFFFLELEELWLLTRKPEDPTFKFVADFSNSISDIRNRISEIDFSIPYPRWNEEMTAAVSALKEKIHNYNIPGGFPGKAGQKFTRLITEMNLTLDKINISEQYNRKITFLSSYLSKNIQMVEEFSLQKVARRRRITEYWKLTVDRIQNRKVFRFIFSLPKVAYVAVKDLRMSLPFAFKLLFRN
ncbi:MAG: radical SAM protein [Candidatus Latescibacterota bacterium]